MKITIDTDNKTLEVVSEITIQELNKFIEDYKLQNYKIIPKYNIPLSVGFTPLTPNYPYVVPYGTGNPMINTPYIVTC